MGKLTRKGAMKKAATEFRERTGVAFTLKMTGKMEGMIALSTSPNGNERCKARAECGNENCVCTKCYSIASMKYKRNLDKMTEENGKRLSEKVIPVDEWLVIDPLVYPLGREEAHGDLRNAIHYINMNNLSIRNPKIPMALWTKNGDYIRTATDMGHVKADNLTVLGSSPQLNTEIDLDEHPEYDKVFTVYTYKYIKEHKLTPLFFNCGARHCLSCGKCYHKDNGIRYIHEILKKDTKRVYKLWASQGWTDLDTDHPHLVTKANA